MFTPAVRATTIKLKREERVLEVAFTDGTACRLPAELLRVESPSAEVQGHSPSQKQIVAGKSQVGITTIEAVGNYAIRLLFDDGHDSGIFTWTYLHQLGHNHERIWADYLANLARQGLSR
ncbi:MAG: DUF971 domain-containing protein [Azospirillaceae bacterium]|nr:DUF971 domain-containing protein [Azospirillaceae bacterium]